MNHSNVLKIGTNIKIKRTDGRVHEAFVAGINFANNTATVEWMEGNETKGKEIELVSIRDLNPSLIVRHQPEKQIETSASVSKIQTRRQQPSATSVGAGCYPSLTPDYLSITGAIRMPPEAEPVKQTSSFRRNSVLKEVEKIKQKRQERRQKHAEEKAEKEALHQGTPGNPHWELIHMINEYREGLILQPLTEYDSVEEHLITVCVRKRPLNLKEIDKKEVDVVTIPCKNQILVHEPKTKVDLTRFLDNQSFRFDYAFDESCTNNTVYKYSTQPLIKTIFGGGFATCFAYGQTGSGKTHTMGGNFIGRNQDCTKGIYAMAASDIFKLVRSPNYHHLNLSVVSSFFEIYSGKVFDLLAKKAKLRILEDGHQQVQIVNLSEKAVSNVDDVLKLVTKGSMARTSGQTAANEYSSRSHAVFQLILKSNEKVYGKFSFIDLAGNERGADTSSSDRQTRMEGAEINKSLLALKECIRALGRKGTHLPFRLSKLTLVLKDSFVGANSRTCMIAMISPGVSSCEHSLNTLRYADRVKELGLYDSHINNQNSNSSIEQIIEKSMPPELVNVHNLISEFQNAEDAMLDNHRQLIENLSVASTQGQRLLDVAENVEYNYEEYCEAWLDILKNAGKAINQSLEIVKSFKRKMMEEERINCRNKHK